MEFRDLNEQEKMWIDFLLSKDFLYREIILKQIVNAKVKYEHCGSYISLKFKKNNNGSKYPLNVRVPIEMRAFQRDMAPVVFLLHIIDGYVDELEVFSADLTELNEKDISFNNLQFEINDDVK